MGDHRPVVLVVEDEPGLADLYSSWLAPAYTVRTAYTGEEALPHLDDDLDVALVDRRLPEWTGEEVVRVLRSRELDCRAALVTAVDADFDIVDMPIDAYLRKPVDRSTLHATVEELLARTDRPSDERALLALLSRKRALEQEKSTGELRGSEAFGTLEGRIERMASALQARPAPIDSKYRPSECPECGFRWDVAVGGTVGFRKLGSAIWTCRECGQLAGGRGPSYRRVNRR